MTFKYRKQRRHSIFLDSAKITIYDIRYYKHGLRTGIMLIINNMLYYTEEIWRGGTFRHPNSDIITEILDADCGYVCHPIGTKLSRIIKFDEVCMDRPTMRPIILSTLRPECICSKKCIRLEIPSTHPVPFYYVINMRHNLSQVVVQWGRYELIPGFMPQRIRYDRDPALDIQSYRVVISRFWYPRGYSNCNAWLENNPELYKIGVSMENLGACMRAPDNQALVDIIEHIAAPKNVQKRLYDIFEHRNFAHAHIVANMHVIALLSTYLISDITDIVIAYR
jgi:hypothetical protein